MNKVHELTRSPKYWQNDDYTHMAVIGCGGTGAAFAGGLPFFQQAMELAGFPRISVTLVDPDRVSATNCVRQPFSQSEVGHHKALVLANRVNLFWDYGWNAITEPVTELTTGDVDILVTCVDTRAARQQITRSGMFQKVRYWLDIGNNADNGQFVLGQPRNKRNGKLEHRIPTVAELYPEILDAKLDGKDTLPTCSSVEALQRQEPFVNQVLASHALFLLTRLFRYRRIDHQGLFINLNTGRTGVIPVEWREPKSKGKTLAEVFAEEDGFPIPKAA